MIHIMLDLEMNKVPTMVNEKGKKLSNEIIEIGAVKMNDKYEIIDKFQTYVHPQYATMDSFITKITGITDETLKDAPEFEEAMGSFLKWIGDESTTYYSWSMTDLRQLQSETAFKEMYNPEVRKMGQNWVDFQAVFGKLLNVKKSIKLKDAVASADYEFSGTPHTALSDALNTAEIFILSKHEDEFNRVMKPVIDLFKTEKPGSSLGQMCADFFENYNVEGE